MSHLRTKTGRIATVRSSYLISREFRFANSVEAVLAGRQIAVILIAGRYPKHPCRLLRKIQKLSNEAAKSP